MLKEYSMSSGIIVFIYIVNLKFNVNLGASISFKE